ncbi:MAG: hypothetical protein R3263_01770 [Myxococcota bacterium]|nr:hypothetical protein [Myxococcota bacterium]
MLFAVVVGCSYSHGRIDYSESPELRNVRLYTGRPDPTGVELADLETVHEASGSCSEVAVQALNDLVEDARAIGADGVKDVKFRGRWHWMGRVVCRPELGGKSVRVRGTAYREAAD